MVKYDDRHNYQQDNLLAYHTCRLVQSYLQRNQLAGDDPLKPELALTDTDYHQT